MEDREIINLYLARDTNAIKETASKYGRYCKTIAQNILGINEDAEECVNDTYLNTWHSIPPHHPHVLSAYLGKITRNLSFDRFRHRYANKRGGGELQLVLEELEECVSGTDSTEQPLETQEMIQAINTFLDTIPQEKCNIFLCRYWYALPVTEIAARFCMSEGNVSVTLNRLRYKLKKHLKERGYDL